MVAVVVPAAAAAVAGTAAVVVADTELGVDSVQTLESRVEYWAVIVIDLDEGRP